MEWKKLSDRPLNDYDRLNPETEYWTNGTHVYCGVGETHLEQWDGDVKSYYETHIKGANPKTFLYAGQFGKDDQRCYSRWGRWLKSADVETFNVLNYTYAIDKNYVFTATGTVKNVDIKSFEVLDDGEFFLWYNNANIPEYSPYGYAKDKNCVYYENFEGKTKIIKKADVETFISYGDAYFASDKNHVYANGRIIKKANPQTWRKFTDIPLSYYSRDDSHVYCGNVEMEVDYESFEVILPVNAKSIPIQFAKDKNKLYCNGVVISTKSYKREIKTYESVHGISNVWA